MIELSTASVAAICAATTGAYVIFGFAGFGANMVALPLIAQVVSLRFAVPLMTSLDLIAAALLSFQHRALIDRTELKRLTPALLCGMALGLPVLQHVPERWLLLALGLFVGALALWNLFGSANARPTSPRWVWPAGVVGGVFSTLFGTGGPVFTLYLAGRIADTSQLRASIAAVILGAALMRLLLFTGSGLFMQPGLLRLAAILVPCALAGYWIGGWLHARAPQAQVRRAIWGLLLLSSASLIVRATFGA